TLRQKTTLVGAGVRAGAAAEALATAPASKLQSLDWMKFAEKFRGTEEYVKKHLSIYVDRFKGCAPVLDIGCGRGEMLEIFRDAGIAARGIDLNDDCIAACVNKGLDAERADLFEYLSSKPDGSLGGVIAMQLVEHLPPERLPEFIALVHAKLKSGAPFAMETPNPECLAIFAKHFFLDPTHAKPVPHGLLAFYLEEAGFGRLETILLEPAVESMPALQSIPEDFRREFFGCLDYAIVGRRL
ncbi:MAG: methyltransferase domain-containing protein, partial [Acidobacteriaceae bacterium]|nr:methyltransferase domain-containing protein [Acidobacteriaceae bacterium]